MTAGVQLEPTTQRLLTANGTAIRVDGRATMEAAAGSQRLTISGLASPLVNEVMLGIDFLEHQKAIWNFDARQIIIGGFHHTLYSKGRHTWCRRVVLQEDVVVPARSELDLSTLVQYSDAASLRDRRETSWITTTRQVSPGLCVSRTIVPDRNEDVPVRVVNLSSSAIKVKAGTVVADLDVATVCRAEEDAMADDGGQSQDFSEMVSHVHESADITGRARLTSLLKEFSSVFSKGENDLLWTDLVTHTIDTGVSKPVRQPLRRHPPAHLDAIQQHVGNMLEQGVIEPARSPWASNIVLVNL